MTVYIEKPAQNLREELAALRAQVRASETQDFLYAGNGTQTAFPLPQGWRPKRVFVNGALFRPGAGEDYTISFDGFLYSVVMAVAPSTVDVAIVSQRDI